MKPVLLFFAALLFFTAPVYADAIIGQQAPDFAGTDSKGQMQTLSQYKGKIVVLEWSNPSCPYVAKHYNSMNMQNLQKEEITQGVVWLTVVSSAEGKEGFMTPAEAEKYMAEKHTMPTARILDPSGQIGTLYGAKTTPTMFVIDPKGTLVYGGAIDDNDSFKPETIATAKNYVRAAVASVKAGKPVEVSSTKSYGCSVKYAY